MVLAVHGENFLIDEEEVLEAALPEMTEQFFRALQPVLLGLVCQCVSLQ